MSGATILASLRALCRDLDAGRSPQPIPWRRVLLPLAVPAAIGLAAAGAGCAREDCHDGADNDRDGLVDCEDPDCEAVLGCRAAPEYAAPMPEQEAVDRTEPAPVPADGLPSHAADAAPEPARPEAGPGADASLASSDAAAGGSRAAEGASPTDGGARRASPNLKAPLRLKAIPQIRRDPVTVLYACPFV